MGLTFEQAIDGAEIHDCCVHFARDWRETKNFRYPISSHSPACKNYKTETFKGVRMVGDIAACIVETLDEAKEIAGDDPEFEIIDIELTRDQFERLPEHGGW